MFKTPTGSIVKSGETLEAIHLKLGMGKGCPSPFLFNILQEVVVHT